MRTARTSMQGVVRVGLPPGGRYLTVQLSGDATRIPVLVPAGLASTPKVGDAVLVDMVGRVPVLRGGA